MVSTVGIDSKVSWTGYMYSQQGECTDNANANIRA